ncbi:MAG: LamG domain-containing protein, partial [Chloroflexi bacterium]|nr:LamG domain-containing protein [Chloroflexota bacterium]
MKTLKAAIILVIVVGLAAGLMTQDGAHVQASHPPGPVAFWAMDTGTGSIAVDSSGDGNAGELSGGRFGNGLLFDGVDDFLSVGADASLNITDPLTVEAWVRADAGSLGTVFRAIVSKEDSGGRGYGLIIDSAGKLRFQINFASVPGTCISASTIAEGTFVHLAGTYDGTTIKCFVNAALDGSSAFSVALVNSPSDLRIGKSSAVSAGFFD